MRNLCVLRCCRFAPHVTSHPVYNGPTEVEWLNPSAFNERVTTTTRRKDADVAWVVMFYADWSPSCAHLDPTFAAISRDFTTSTLRFAKVDLGRWPQVAKQHSINLDAFGSASQVPTIILFEKGEERARLPQLYEDGGRVTGSRMRRVDIVKGFELDVRYAKSKPSDTEGSDGAGVSKPKGKVAKKKD